jgi:hypothetical protein
VSLCQLGADVLLEAIKFARFNPDFETVRDLVGICEALIVCVGSFDVVGAEIRADVDFRSIDSQVRATLLPIEKDLVFFWTSAMLAERGLGA